MPSFLADTSHRMKGVSKHIFLIVNDVKTHRCGCTKAYALRLNKYLGYMINNIEIVLVFCKFEQEKALHMKLEEEIYQENFISYF